jgi:hypothetical protein
MAEGRIDQKDYKQFERVMVLHQCLQSGYTTLDDVKEADLAMYKVDPSAMRSQFKGLPYVLKYIGPDNTQQLVYILEAVAYRRPLTAATICTNI